MRVDASCGKVEVENSLVQVVGPNDNWVLEKQARQLVSKLPYARFLALKPTADSSTRLIYYVNYALFQHKTQNIDVGFFTHNDTEQHFIERARSMDWAVCMSKIYADLLHSRGIETVTHIPVGFDFYRFQPKLIVGVVGLLQHPRKGKHLVDRVESLEFVEMRKTEGQLTQDELVEFYKILDFVLIPATVEGGPMSLLEALSSGTAVIAPAGVGVIPEFPESSLIRRYPTGDADALVELMKACYREKSEGQKLVENRTLDLWAESHHILFRQLIVDRGISFQDPAPGFRFGMMKELELSPRMDTVSIEQIVDEAAAHLYFGRNDQAATILRNGSERFPCLIKLHDSIPMGRRSNTLIGDLPNVVTNDLRQQMPCATFPNILVIAHVGTLRDRMDKSHFLRYMALSQRPGVTLFGPGLASYQSGMSLEDAIAVACNGNYPDVVIHGGDLRDSGIPIVTGLQQARCLTAIELLDTWANPDRTLQFIRQHRFNIGLIQESSFHLDFFRRHCPETDFYWTPNAVDTKLFQDYQLPKIYDVIFYGVLEPQIYPFRQRLFELLKSAKNLRVRLIEHPGYYPQGTSKHTDVISGAMLSKEINQSWIGIATRSIYNCLLMKYLEISASRAVVAGNVPDSGHELLRGCIIELTEEMTDDEIVGTLLKYLADKNRLQRMAAVLSHRVSSHFSTEAFAGQVVALCNQLVVNKSK